MKEINIDLTSNNVEKITVNFQKSCCVTVVYSDGSTAKHEFTEAVDAGPVAGQNTTESEVVKETLDMPVMQDENDTSSVNTHEELPENIPEGITSWTPDVAALFLKELSEIPISEVMSKWGMSDVKEVTAVRNYFEGKFPGMACVAENFEDILNGNIPVADANEPNTEGNKN